MTDEREAADTGAQEAKTTPPSTGAEDRWAPFDAVLQAFAAERRLAVGTYLAEQAAESAGRFVRWLNAAGWRCTLQLVPAPQEQPVVLVVQGPPLPGGRPRVLVLGAFPPEFDPALLRAALELGYGIGETWGPAEPEPEGAGEPPAGAQAQATG